MPVNAQTYASVDASLQAFDYSGAMHRFGAVAVIRGDRDFVDPSTIGRAARSSRHDIVLQDVGHYPFFEAPYPPSTKQ